MRARVQMQGKFHEKQGKTAAKPEAAHGIRKKERNFTRTKRNFYVSVNEKPTAPQRKTYGSHGGNIRFAEGKHKNKRNILKSYA